MNRYSAAALVLLLGLIFFSACLVPAGQTGPQDRSQAAAEAAAQAGSRPAAAAVTQEQVLPEYTGPSYLYPLFNELRKEGPIIPGLRQPLVPQGMAFWSQEDLMIISNYASDGSAGVLTLTGMEDGQLQKALYLMDDESTPHTGHLGGLAVSPDHLWIASGPGVYALPLSTLHDSKNGSRIVLPELLVTETKGSFATFHEGVLWVGEFTRIDGSYAVSESHHRSTRDGKSNRGWLGGYRLSEQTDLPELERSVNGRLQPEFVLSIPDDIQGALFFDQYILLSSSYGRGNDSRLILYESPLYLQEPPHETPHETVNLWYLDRYNRIGDFRAPPMSQAAVLYSGMAAVLFESAAELYRDTAKHPVDRIQMIPLTLLVQQLTDLRK